MKKMKKLVCYVLLFMLCLQNNSILLSGPTENTLVDTFCNLANKRN